jgi:hypothetical protein
MKIILTTNYLAVIGPGTAWRKDGPVKFSDLPDGGSHTIMLVEVANSDVHWAEPRDITVEEALEGLKTGKGLRISTAHPDGINVLYANDDVEAFPAKMPISLWEKILAGKINSREISMEIDTFNRNNPDSTPNIVDVLIRPSQPGKLLIISGIVIWLLSIVLLFRRAIKSRRNR